MKTLVLSLLIFINTVQFSSAQNNPNKANQIFVTTEIEDGITTLYWESNREVNSSYYLIEKSLDGLTFQIIGTQKAGSSTYQKTAYLHEDIDSNGPTTLYRITLVSMDGSSISTLSNSNSIENIAVNIEK